MGKLMVRFKLWLNSDEADGVFGDGKWRLLKAIDKEGSLKAASESQHISYRKAWGDLRKMEDTLQIGLVERERGGDKGGRTGLTDQGRKWLKAYTGFRRDIERAAQEAYKKHFRELEQ
jgi:molybdate transport system regulatory protein